MCRSRNAETLRVSKIIHAGLYRWRSSANKNYTNFLQSIYSRKITNWNLKMNLFFIHPQLEVQQKSVKICHKASNIVDVVMFALILPQRKANIQSVCVFFFNYNKEDELKWGTNIKRKYRNCLQKSTLNGVPSPSQPPHWWHLHIAKRIPNIFCTPECGYWYQGNQIFTDWIDDDFFRVFCFFFIRVNINTHNNLWANYVFFSFHNLHQ